MVLMGYLSMFEDMSLWSIRVEMLVRHLVEEKIILVVLDQIIGVELKASMVIYVRVCREDRLVVVDNIVNIISYG